MLLTDNGVVYVCGKHDHGALGMKIHVEGKRVFHPHVIPETVPLDQHDTTILSLDPSSYLHTTTVSAQYPLMKYIGPIIQIAAGMKHTLLLAANGRVYAAGRNQFGQCGFQALDVLTPSAPSSSPSSSSTLSSTLSTTLSTSLSSSLPASTSPPHHH